MTIHSVANLPPSPQAANPPAVELSWDDALDGNFPPTRQQRLQQAALQAAEQLQEQADLPVTQDEETTRLVEAQLAAVARDRQLPQEGEGYPTADAAHEMRIRKYGRFWGIYDVDGLLRFEDIPLMEYH